MRNAFMLEDGALSPHNKQDEATIRFAPPSDGLYAEEVFYPPATGQPARPDLLGRDCECNLHTRCSFSVLFYYAVKVFPAWMSRKRHV